MEVAETEDAISMHTLMSLVLRWPPEAFAEVQQLVGAAQGHREQLQARRESLRASREQLERLGPEGEAAYEAEARAVQELTFALRADHSQLLHVLAPLCRLPRLKPVSAASPKAKPRVAAREETLPKTLQILQALLERPLSLPELQERLGWPKRLFTSRLAVAKNNRWIQCDPTGRFVVTDKGQAWMRPWLGASADAAREGFPQESLDPDPSAG